MVLSFSKIALGMFGLLGTGGLGLAGTYQFTKKTIKDGLTIEPVSVESSDDSNTLDAWNKLLAKLNGSVEPKPKSEKFKKIKPKSGSVEAATLKELCKSVIDDFYSSIFSKDEDLLIDATNFCSLPLREMVTTGKTLSEGNTPDTNDITELTKRLSELTSHDDDTHGKLDSILESLKSTNASTPDTERQNRLFNWCKENYKKGYINDSQNLKKLVLKYCKKD